jgi:hypothetical protein
MSCECHQIGGRFIAEDPDCPAHGLEAQRERASFEAERDRLVERLERAMECGDDLYDTASDALEFIRGL